MEEAVISQIKTNKLNLWFLHSQVKELKTHCNNDLESYCKIENLKEKINSLSREQFNLRVKYTIIVNPEMDYLQRNLNRLIELYQNKTKILERNQRQYTYLLQGCITENIKKELIRIENLIIHLQNAIRQIINDITNISIKKNKYLRHKYKCTCEECYIKIEIISL